MSDKHQDNTLLISYDCTSGSFTYHTPLDAIGCRADARPLWQILLEDGAAREDTSVPFRKYLMEAASASAPYVNFTELCFHYPAQGWRCCRVGFICAIPGTSVTVTITDISDISTSSESLSQSCTFDPLTHLLDRDSFCRLVDLLLQADPESAENGGYAMLSFDLHRFKVINDLFGRDQGDRLLQHMAKVLRQHLPLQGCACRMAADDFTVFIPTAENYPETLINTLQAAVSEYDLPFEINFHAGIYITNAEPLNANAMIDRADIAQHSIKGQYNLRFAYYDESMRRKLLGEQEMVGMMSAALSEEQFLVYYQPQYNHSTGMLIGAEALVRWSHPELGLISPGVFIPIFEKNGSITNLDLYIFEKVCRFLRKAIDSHWAIVPISTNFSRYDVFMPDFVSMLENIRSRYDIPAKYLRVELTESAMMEGTVYVNTVIGQLHSCGYIVEMDDFGSGYSSLNVLKDIDLDIIKLDMNFLAESAQAHKGGTILSSVVRMAKWLQMPVIAEGVETVEQADFLKSIGCDYVQGYLYSRPLPEDEYAKLLCGSRIGAMVPQLELIETLNANNFWNPNSQETLLFSSYVGAACIFSYHNNSVEILRVNKKYLSELSMNMTERDIIESDPLSCMDEDNRKVFLDMLHRAIDTYEEQECETWRTITSACCGTERFCIRSNVRVIGVSGDQYLFHSMIRNVTNERMYYNALKDSERRFKAASEQVNIYYWEYTVSSHEMRPCFRCMRDLGLPPLLTNYPDSAIEAGIFPPEVADMYRDWHRQIEAGVPSLEAVIPLTMDRVPFHVRYTTEFDENNNPVKAYGSAALVVPVQ